MNISDALNDLLKYGSYALRGGCVFFTRNCAYIELGRFDEAIADLSRAVETDPHSAKSLRERGRAYRMKGLIDLAEQDERAAAKLER